MKTTSSTNFLMEMCVVFVLGLAPCLNWTSWCWSSKAYRSKWLSDIPSGGGFFVSNIFFFLSSPILIPKVANCWFWLCMIVLCQSFTRIELRRLLWFRDTNSLSSKYYVMFLWLLPKSNRAYLGKIELLAGVLWCLVSKCTRSIVSRGVGIVSLAVMTIWYTRNIFSAVETEQFKDIVLVVT